MIARLYRRFPAMLMARRNLSRATIRSALAALGIIIGVVAIASLGMFGTSLQQSATGSLGDIGTDVLVSPSYESGVEHLDDRDVRTIRRVSSDAAVVPIKNDRVRLTFGSDEQVVAAYGMAEPGSLFEVAEGRMPAELRGGVVVGADLAERLDLRAGNSIRIDGTTYRVHAVLERQSAFSPVDPNAAVILPSDDFDGEGYDQVMVVAESGSAANESALAIRESLNDREQRVDVFELREVTEQIGDFFDVLNLFLLGIGSISLLVAGVSILNVMLMSVVERREEIGVLRAVGFRKRDVLVVMLAEAALLGVAGGLVGVALSVGVGAVLNHFTLGDPMATFGLRNLGFLAVAFAFGVGTSVLSGLYPAWKAANEQPVDALRN